MKVSILIIALMLASAAHGFSQYSFSGTLSDDTDEALVGAVVLIEELNRSTLSDAVGGFEFTNLRAGTYTIQIAHVGTMDFTEAVVMTESLSVQWVLASRTILAEEVIVQSTRASENSPVTYTELNKNEIKELNSGQDLPFVLNFTPSIVTTSDAGAGIGYTGLRIRGTDATRINVTINGVSLNDSESQGVFWVNIPDIASSTQSVQVQRGVGTSTNGAAAFGGTINLQTLHLDNAPYAELINGFGSFNSRRHTLLFGTGLLNGHWAIDGRISKIKSDGYIDRATSDLDAYYFSAGYYGKKTIVKAIAFGGDERTYQSWYGTPQAVLEDDPEGIEAVIGNNGLDEEQAENMRTAGRTFNWYLYEDQVDDYGQDHYQLHASHRFSEKFTGQLTLHYTKGQGFFEQYEREAAFSAYGLPNAVAGDSVITSTDLVQRRWLDNDFWGLTYGVNILPTSRDQLTIGGAWNTYDGGHFGEVIWTETAAANVPKDFRYYDNTGKKTDFSVYAKYNRSIAERWNLFADLQYRYINYEVDGIDNDLRDLAISESYHFFNPKVGLSAQLSDQTTAYASFAVANREPVRTDFIDADVIPDPERLNNLEAGIRKSGGPFSWEANLYYMDYRDQLVLTGELNDVGSSLRTNVDKSYRAGIELQAQWNINERFFWVANATFSRNKIDAFTEIIYDYGPNFDEFNIIENAYSNTDIAFSPNVIVGSQLTAIIAKELFHSSDQLDITLLSKFVGNQYLDNTSNEARQIANYFVNDLRIHYQLSEKVLKGLDFTFLVNNLFGVKYSSNGYTFGYQGGADFVVRENYYYPQALTNVMGTLALRF